MPSTSEKQRRFMGMKLAQQRKTGHNSTGMSEDQLSDFAHKVKSHGSLPDIDALDADADSTLDLEGFLYKEGDECHESAERNFEKLSTWEIREIKNLPGYKVEVVFMGPDTQFRAEEIDMVQYGRDYEPIPLRDYYKSFDKPKERSFRASQQDMYDETETPGTVTEGKNPQTDHRTFKDQQEYLRAVVEADEPYAVQIEGIDTKHGRKFR